MEQDSYALELPGPITGKYFKHDDAVLSAWTPCGSTSTMFNVNTEVALTPAGKSVSGTLSATKESGRFTGVLYLKWQEC